MNGVLGHDSALLRLYWAGDNLGKWDEFCHESCPWHRIDRSTCWPAVLCATTVPQMPPLIVKGVVHQMHMAAGWSYITREAVHQKYLFLLDTTRTTSVQLKKWEELGHNCDLLTADKDREKMLNPGTGGWRHKLSI